MTQSKAMADSETKTPKDKLLIVLRKGQAERVAAMLDQFPEELDANMNADSADNKLMHRAARYGHSKVIETLVKKGGDVMMPNKFGMTPLHHGAVHGGKDVLKALLDAGADPNKADDAGRLPLHWTATKGHMDGSKVLIDGGAKALGPDKEGFTPLHRCCQEEPVSANSEEPAEKYKAKLDKAKAEVAKLLLSKGADVNAKEPKGQQMPIHLSAMNGLPAVTEVLIKAGASINAVNKIGQTPLIYSIIEEHVPVIDLLISSGADVNYGNRLHSDWASIHWAALTDNIQVVDAVLKSDKVKNVKDRSGRYPDTLAIEHGKQKVVQRLEKLSKR